jgi:hypothetical protein
MDNLPKLHTCAKVECDTGVQEVERHFVQDLGARPEHEANKEYCEEGVGETDTVMDLQNFGDDENGLDSLVGGQLDDLTLG